MGGIEECEGSSCHGALMEMKASEVRYSTRNKTIEIIAFQSLHFNDCIH